MTETLIISARLLGFGIVFQIVVLFTPFPAFSQGIINLLSSPDFDLAEITVSAMTATPDSGFIAVGVHHDRQGAHGIVMKFDGTGRVAWCKSVGSGALSAVTGSNGNYFAAGLTDSTESRKGWIVRFGLGGDLSWSKHFSLTKSNHLYSIAAGHSGQVAAVGRAEREWPKKRIAPTEIGGWILLVDQDGKELVSRADPHVPYTINATEDGYMVVGSKYDFETIRHDGGVITKLDKNGNELWSTLHIDLAFTFLTSGKNGFTVRTSRLRPARRQKFNWLSRKDTIGDTWSSVKLKKYHHSAMGSIVNLADGHIELGSGSYIPRKNWLKFFISRDYKERRYGFAVKFGVDGKVEWKKKLNCEITSGSDVHIYDATLLADGYLIAVSKIRGRYSSGWCLIKIDSGGNTLWSREFVRDHQWTIEQE